MSLIADWLESSDGFAAMGENQALALFHPSQNPLRVAPEGQHRYFLHRVSQIEGEVQVHLTSSSLTTQSETPGEEPLIRLVLRLLERCQPDLIVFGLDFQFEANAPESR